MRHTRRFLALALTTALASTLASPSLANAQALTTGQGASGDELIVTGSRILQEDVESDHPVLSLDADSIIAAGTTNLTDFLTEYPALLGSSTSADNSGEDAENGRTGLNLLNMRNLGTERTLVLVDGRRHVGALPGSQAVDINTIPSDLVERIDIMTGGASAIYGSDGVTGVVNFVLKRDYEGLNARAQAGISEHGDAGQRFASLSWGHNFADGRANAALAYEYGKEDRLAAHDRARLRGVDAAGLYLNPANMESGGDNDDGVPDYIPLSNIRFFDSAREGGIDVDFDGFPDFLGADGVRFDRGGFVPDFFQQGGNATLVSDYANDLAPSIERHIVNAIGHFDVAPALRLFAEAKFADVDAFSLSQPTFDYYLFIDEANPFIPDAVRAAIVPGLGSQIFRGDGLLLTRDNFDLGRRGENVERKTYRGVAGARGDLSPRLRYELSYVYGRSEIASRYLNDILDDRFFAAIDVVTDPATGRPVCRVQLDPNWTPDQAMAAMTGVRDVRGPTTFQPGQCVPLNLFGEYRNSAAALDFIRADTRDQATLVQHVAGASLSGELGGAFSLPGGDPGFALGVERRVEKSVFAPDPLASLGLTFVNALGASAGGFSVNEAFGEIRAPLLRRRPFAHHLELSAAIRFSNYSTVGNATTWKIGGSYAPLSWVSFHGTYSRAVRAPNLGELFGAPSEVFRSIVDPCNNNQTANGSASRAANCAALLASLGVANPASFLDQRATTITGVRSGNAELKEEKALSLTAGASLRPTWLPGLSIRTDWYDISLDNAVNYVEAQQLARLCVDQPSLDNIFCTAIQRQQGGPNAGLITGFRIAPQNVARFATAGLDVTVDYRLSAGRWGSFDLRLVGNYLDKLEYIGTPGAPVTVAREEINAPKYQLNLDLGWSRGPYRINYGFSAFSRTLRFTNQEVEANPDIAAPQHLRYKGRRVHDLSVSADIAGGLRLYGGINNLLGQRPDIGADSYPVSSVGRFFFAGARLSLGRR